jgi:tRNA (guanine37-N1)-methyltransferase
MRIDLFTLFPEFFDGFLATSIPRLAQEKGLVQVQRHDLRRFGEGGYRRVDERPFGGGPGMVIMPGPVVECIESVTVAPRPPLIMLSPQGRRFDQRLAEELARLPRLLILCGHYEGFDERIALELAPLEVSIGDFVLSGGEVAALVLMDAVVRLVPAVLGDARSIELESFADGLLEHAHYTRPVEFRGREVPHVLRSGHHGAIEAWRRAQALERTRKRRPDLLIES